MLRKLNLRQKKKCFFYNKNVYDYSIETSSLIGLTPVEKLAFITFTDISP